MNPIPTAASVLLRISILAGFAVSATSASAQFATSGDEIRAHPKVLGAQWRPAMARLGDGGFVLAWQDHEGAVKFRIYEATFVPRTGVLAADDEPLVSQTNFTPAVAALSGGNFAVIWEARSDMVSVLDIYARVFNASGQPLGEEFMVNTTTAEAQVRPTAALFGDGRVLVAWQHDNGSHTDIHYRIYNSNFAAPGTVQIANVTTDRHQMRPKAASLTNGLIALVWDSEETAYVYDSYARLFNSSGALGGEVRVNTYTTSSQMAPDVTALPDGGAVVAWQSYEQDGAAWGVYAQRFATNTTTNLLEPVGGEFRTNTHTAGSQLTPRLTSWGTGFLATWTSENIGRNSGDDDRETGEDGDGAGVYARAYGIDGVPEGDPFQINQTTAHHQYDGVPLSLSPGRVVVAWSSKEDEDYDDDPPFYYDDIFFRLVTDGSSIPEGPGTPGTSASPVMKVTSAAAARFSIRNGKPAPKVRKYVVRNASSASLAWRIASRPPRWLKVAPSSGSLAPNASRQVRLSLVPKRLPKRSSIQTRLKFDAMGLASGDTTRKVVVKNPRR